MRTVTIGKVRYRVRVVKDAQRHKARAGYESPSDLHGYLDEDAIAAGEEALAPILRRFGFRPF